MNIRAILLGFVILLLLSSLAGGLSYYTFLKNSVLHEIRDKTAVSAKSLRDDINVYIDSNLKPVSALAALPAISRAIANPDKKTLAVANAMLDHFCTVFSASDCYLMDRKGVTIATSNRNTPMSFLGKNYDFRPYFKLAMEGKPATYAALGVVTKKRGIYFSFPVYLSKQSQPAGVVVTKYLVDTLEQTFQMTRGIYALTDPNGVVFVANRTDWLLRTVETIKKHRRAMLISSRQFGEISPDAIGLHHTSNQRVVDQSGNSYLYQKLTIDAFPDWHLLYLRNTDEVNDILLGRLSGWVISLVLGLLVLIVLSATVLYRIGSSDIKRRRLAEKAMHESEEHLRRWNNALAQLVKSKVPSQGDLKSTLYEITEVTSKNIDVERVSVWLFSNDRTLLHCHDLYTQQQNEHSEGMELPAHEYPRYFKALEDKRVISADDALTDPDTSEFADSYLRPLGITSMLDAGIRVEGEVLGVLCCEHVRSSRHWGADEHNFVGAVADLVALALQAECRKQTEMALRSNEASLAEAQRIARLGNWEWDMVNEELSWSKETYRIFNLSPLESDATFKTYLEVVHPDDRELVKETFRDALSNKTRFTIDHRVVLPSGEVRIVHENSETTFDADGNGIRMLGTVQDITETKRAEQEMAKLSRALEQTADAIIITDRSGTIEYVNSAFEKITGFKKEEAVGNNPRIFKSNKHDAAFYKNLWATILADKVFREILINRRKNGALYYQEITINSVKNTQGEITHFVSSGKDISDRMQVQERLAYLAHHDVVTDLPNRALFIERLEHAVKRAKRTDSQLAVLFLDLDWFKNINDTLGHGIGDLLLVSVAKRILKCLRDGDTAARLGGDEFTILLEGSDKEDSALIAARLMEAISCPFQMGDDELFIGASIGICHYPQHGYDAETLVKNADTAMYRAKEKGRNNFQHYTKDMSERISNRLALETSLRHALERKQMFLVYQPLVDLASGDVYGVEALLRWNHPEHGSISTLDFIPVLEETGLIVSVGEWVLYTACTQAVAWQQQGLDSLRLSVNISGRQFNDNRLTERVIGILQRTGMNASNLQLEITESVIMEHATQMTDILTELTRSGISMAIDDFGTGYSSLSYLKRLPVDTVKIDRSFVMDITTDKEDAVIVKSIITLAHSLKLDVVAEGVETNEQLEFLRAHSCDAMQGNLFSEPLPAKQVEKLLHTSQRKKKRA